MELVTGLFATTLFCILIGVLYKGRQAMCWKGDMWAGNGGADNLHSNTAK